MRVLFSGNTRADCRSLMKREKATMAYKACNEKLLLAAAITLIFFASSLAPPAAANQEPPPENLPPAGQRCPNGHYVIGFDARSNIICSGVCGNAVVDTGEACDDGNTDSGDGCSEACRSEGATNALGDTEQAKQATVLEAATTANLQGPEITDVEPSSVVFGASDVTVYIIGTGFDETSVVLFDGKTYQPAVNSAGTQLIFKPDTARLSLGAYAITVSNDSGLKATRKRGLVIF